MDRKIIATAGAAGALAAITTGAVLLAAPAIATGVAAQAGVDVEDVIQALADFEALVAASGVTLVNYADNAAQQTAGQTPPENVPAG